MNTIIYKDRTDGKRIGNAVGVSLRLTPSYVSDEISCMLFMSRFADEVYKVMLDNFLFTKYEKFLSETGDENLYLLNKKCNNEIIVLNSGTRITTTPGIVIYNDITEYSPEDYLEYNIPMYQMCQEFTLYHRGGPKLIFTLTRFEFGGKWVFKFQMNHSKSIPPKFIYNIINKVSRQCSGLYDFIWDETYVNVFSIIMDNVLDIKIKKHREVFFMIPIVKDIALAKVNREWKQYFNLMYGHINRRMKNE